MNTLGIKDLQRITSKSLDEPGVITVNGVPKAYILPAKEYGGLHLKLDQILAKLEESGVPESGGSIYVKQQKVDEWL